MQIILMELLFMKMKPWSVKVDVALPCATQNELNEDQKKI